MSSLNWVIGFVSVFIHFSMALAQPVRINVDAAPITLDPPLLTDSVSSWVLQHVADRLVEEHKPGQLQGNLAKRWSISPNKKEYCFDIIEGRKFSDGSPLDAAAVAGSIHRAIEKKNKSRVGFYLANIANVKVQNTNSVCFSLYKPAVNFLQILADASFSIDKPNVKQGETQGLVYTGRFKVGRRTNQMIELVRKEDDQIFRLEALTFEDALQRFKTDQLEILRNSGTGGISQLSSLPNKRATMPDERTFFLAFNLKSPIFKKRENREALLQAVDWQKLRQILEQNHLQLSNSLLSPTLFHAGHVFFTPPNHDPQKAAQLPEFRVLTQSGFELESYLKSALNGVKFSQKNLPKAEFLKVLESGDFDLLFTGYGITVRDWDYLSTLFHSLSAHNMISLKDPSIDRLLGQARESEDPTKRLAFYQQVLERNYKEMWYIPVTHTPLVYLFSDKLNTGFIQSDEKILSPWFQLSEIGWNKK